VSNTPDGVSNTARGTTAKTPWYKRVVTADLYAHELDKYEGHELRIPQEALQLQGREHRGGVRRTLVPARDQVVPEAHEPPGEEEALRAVGEGGREEEEAVAEQVERVGRGGGGKLIMDRGESRVLPERCELPARPEHPQLEGGRQRQGSVALMHAGPAACRIPGGQGPETISNLVAGGARAPSQVGVQGRGVFRWHRAPC